ncbi:hypothetical protein H310_02217 [Aphanomyces invadans]|uniref:Uncharacterized protein n=1 Tax=Aphanomyces invadans TaxID=157072 RepID=A0A024UMV2_9STRA|nr:hypothetical protein H310_02217 [Aphanomyces invadans]ETW07786.1 hypothetical protein H310_02217 [Aphanomyces invadans]|eukprot:XP_008863879.1 hypothetical protein H310_02217 [Aphanomyces invadans]
MSAASSTGPPSVEHQVESLRAQVAQLMQEKLEMQTRYQRRIDFLERQVESARATRSYYNRRRSSSISSSEGGSIDWTYHPSMSSRQTCSMVAEQDTRAPAAAGPLKRNWKEMLRHLLGNKRSRDSTSTNSATHQSSLWEAKATTGGKIVFVNSESKPKKKRRGVSGESSWV